MALPAITDCRTGSAADKISLEILMPESAPTRVAKTAKQVRRLIIGAPHVLPQDGVACARSTSALVVRQQETRGCALKELTSSE